METFLNSIVYQNVPASDIERAFELESQGYPPEEAATLEKLEYRQKNAPKLFLGAYLPSIPSNNNNEYLIGFIVSTLTTSHFLTEESMSNHEPDGKTVCIHSVCIDKQYRRRGIATDLLKEYIERLKNLYKYERIVLISHKHLIPLYQKVGFICKGESEIVHGNEKWFDLVLEL
ncbi:9560_t:CDS:2 [Diversispora eburnea]|uniref:9560_t:CDS:1 n=1 Tax=Diversispora eburnea TaxID=1213867 RepID=A0A9N8UX83_9GLOM|nr:9560_t:CDS:2 [Diversispora eburnea]